MYVYSLLLFFLSCLKSNVLIKPEHINILRLLSLIARMNKAFLWYELINMSQKYIISDTINRLIGRNGIG